MHQHKTYGINYRNPERNYTHEAIKGVEYCPTCNELVRVKQLIKVVNFETI